MIRVQDSLSWTQPRGKQAGTTRWPIDYDSVTGIWQTVLLEPLPTVSIESTSFYYCCESGELTYRVYFSGQIDGEQTLEISRNGVPVAKARVETGLRSEARFKVVIEDGELWF